MAARIDVHAHFVPPAYREAAVAAGHSRPDGMPALPEWSPELALETMDALGIAAACLSVSSPGIWFGDAGAAAKLARAVNDSAAELARKYPDRFGFFASLPLPDVPAALAELSRALDELGADGVVLLTNFAGTYLGDPALEPVWQELAARQATVFLHPTGPSCVPVLHRDRPYPLMEFLFDTTRSVTDLVLSGALLRHPGIKLIVPHAGAAFPAMADRIAAISGRLLTDEPGSGEFLQALRGFWYDTAGFPLPGQLGALLHLAERDQLVYGSDWPFTAEQVAQHLAAALDAAPAALLAPGDLDAVRSGNAARLLPALYQRAAGRLGNAGG
jgi:predicted TIM-barrel fold metal-dependent hydrolase